MRSAGRGIYSPHTALDVAEGGTNDVLCDVLGLGERAPLRAVETQVSQCKLVTFVPEEAVEKVSRALFEAGAGRIGKYSSCSFRSAGNGHIFRRSGNATRRRAKRPARTGAGNPAGDSRAAADVTRWSRALRVASI